MFKIGKKASPIHPAPADALPLHKDIADRIRATAAAEAAEREATELYEQAVRDEQWQNLLTALETTYGIPAQWVERENDKSETRMSGYYEGPIRLCGRPMRVASEMVRTGKLEFRIRFIDPDSKDREFIDPAKLADLIERLPATW